LSDDPELTPQEFERLCNELADLDRKALRRKQIEEQLRGAISNGREENRTIIKSERLRRRLQRKADREEREQERKEQRAERLSRLSPETRAKLQARIAELKEYTKEELRQEAIDAQKKAKQDRAALRRWRNGNGSGDEEPGIAEQSDVKLKGDGRWKQRSSKISR
jgi:hypothetical protein